MQWVPTWHTVYAPFEVPWCITDRQAITAAKGSLTNISLPTWLTLILPVTETCQFRSIWSWGQIMWFSIMHIKRPGSSWQVPKARKPKDPSDRPMSTVNLSLLVSTRFGSSFDLWKAKASHKDTSQTESGRGGVRGGGRQKKVVPFSPSRYWKILGIL